MDGNRQLLQHQYPWKRQEVGTLVVLAGIPCVAAWLLVRAEAGRGTLLGTLIPATLLCWGLGLYAFRLGITRKRRSRIEGTLEGTTFAFTGGRFRRSRGDLAEHDRVGLRTQGQEQALVFSRPATDGGPDPEVVVPLRLVRQNAGGHDTLAAQLRRLTQDPQVRVSDQARDVMQAHGL